MLMLIYHKFMPSHTLLNIAYKTKIRVKKLILQSEYHKWVTEQHSYS